MNRDNRIGSHRFDDVVNKQNDFGFCPILLMRQLLAIFLKMSRGYNYSLDAKNLIIHWQDCLVLITFSPDFIFGMFCANSWQNIEGILAKQVFTVPFSDEVYECHKQGKPISELKPNSKLGKSYKQIALKLIKQKRDLKKW